MKKRPRAFLPERHGFTLIELLVVIAIVALLLSILLPALNKAKNEGTKSVCINGLREVLNGTQMYFTDNVCDGVVPWYQMPYHAGFSINSLTPWVFGGFRAPNPETPGGNRDCNAYPAQIRPVNKYIDRTATASLTDFNDRGHDIIKVFKCPGDRTNATATIGSGVPDLDSEQIRSSWESNGSSYTLNTRFYQGYVGNNFSIIINEPPDFPTMTAANARLARNIVGGGASRFIMWEEQGMYGSTYNAAPTLAQSQADAPRYGWHRKFSNWTAGFVDGHVQHGYFDTRIIYGLYGTIWQPNFAGPPDM
jgi:prepilin-type N-terminal cleavage/methylation domain-containing protein